MAQLPVFVDIDDFDTLVVLKYMWRLKDNKAVVAKLIRHHTTAQDFNEPLFRKTRERLQKMGVISK